MNKYLKEFYKELKPYLEGYTIENLDKATKRLYYFMDIINFPNEYERVLNDLKYDYLTLSEINNKLVLWYMDESTNILIFLDDFKILENKEIDKLDIY